jgi:4'-phosphopantetheinyl transferase
VTPPYGVRIAWRAVADGMPRRDVAWELLRERLPPGAAIDNPCPRCGGPHGPVRIRGARAVASVTYAGGRAIVALCAGEDAAGLRAVGIDAEPVQDARRDAAGLAGVLGPGEASVRTWTRVEAALKADGRGLRIDPATVRIEEHPGGWTARVPDGEPVIGWDAAGPDDLVISVAVRPVSEGPVARSG